MAPHEGRLCPSRLIATLTLPLAHHRATGRLTSHHTIANHTMATVFTVRTTPAALLEARELVSHAKQTDPARYWSVSVPAAEHGTVIRLSSPDGPVGLAVVTDAGEIQGLHKCPQATDKGVGARLTQLAVAAGADHLDCFDGPLVSMYQSCGFRETHRVTFDPSFAPPGWDESLHGRPDVVFMELP